MSGIKSIMTDLESAIQHRDTSYTCSFKIGYAAGHILCMSTKRKPELEIVFGTYSDNALKIGLTSQTWDRLHGKVRSFYKQKGIQ